jgi:hypothetical protein
MRTILATLCSALVLAGVAMFVHKVSLKRASLLWFVLFTGIAGGGVAAMTTHAYLQRWGIRHDVRRDGLWSLMDGTANRPFVFRRLAPDFVQVATQLTEAVVPPAQVDDISRKSYLVESYGVPSWDRRKVIAFHWATLLVWFCYFASVVAGAFLLRSVTQISRFVAVLAGVVAVGLLPLTMSVVGGYIYDAPELLLWTLLLALTIRGHYRLLLPLFVAMAFNKESALVAVPPLFVIMLKRSGLRVALVWSALFGAVALAWLLFVRARYNTVPGEAQYNLLSGNLIFWSNPTSYFKFAPLFGPGIFFPRGANVLVLLFLALPLRFGWRSLPLELRWAMAICALEIVPLFIVSGAIDEIRALALLFPFIFVTAVLGVRTMLAHSPVLSGEPPS